MRINSPIRGNQKEIALERNYDMRTQPTKVDLGLEHGNTYEQALRARPADYAPRHNISSSVAYAPIHQPSLNIN